MADPEKPTANMDDSASETASETLRSRSPSVTNEKPSVPGASIQQISEYPTPRTSRDGGVDINRVATAKEAKEAGVDIEKINTSAEGIEYPQGLALGLISLALCLSVFLMALVLRPTQDS